MEISLPNDSYFSFVFGHSFFQIWTVFLLGLARIAPCIAFAPFLGGKSLPDPMKLGLGSIVTLIFLPFLMTQAKTEIALDLTYYLLLVKEAAIGSFLGFIISMPFYYTQGAGALIDHQRGSQSLQVTDPTTQVQTSPTGTLFNNMMLMIFFWIGGPILFFDSIFTSYSVVGMEQFLPASFFDTSRPFWVSTIGLMNNFMKINLQLAAPPLIAMLLSDLFLGIANRMAPQVQISFLLWSLKAFVGIALVWVGWALLIKQLDKEAISWIKVYNNFLQALGK